MVNFIQAIMYKEIRHNKRLHTENLAYGQFSGEPSRWLTTNEVNFSKFDSTIIEDIESEERARNL